MRSRAVVGAPRAYLVCWPPRLEVEHARSIVLMDHPHFLDVQTRIRRTAAPPSICAVRGVLVGELHFGQVTAPSRRRAFAPCVA